MKILIFLIAVFVVFPAWGQQAQKDPFGSVLPQKEKKAAEEKAAEEEKILPDWVNVEAVLWGSELPQAIINGEVYSEGDRIKDLGAVVFKIKSNTVLISYAGKIYQKKPQKREGK